VAPNPPMLPNGNFIKERLHIFGPPKIGKTHQVFQVAKWHHDLGSDAMFYGLNTDTSWEVLYFNEEFQGLPNIQWEDCNYMQDYIAAAKKFHKILRPQDWLILDLADHAWSAAQDEYARAQAKKYGSNIEDMGDLWAVSEAPGDGKYPIEGWEWGQPNARYRVLANNYILRGSGHRLVISSQAKIQEPTAKMKEKEDETAKKTREMFKHLGVHPAGQKDDPFRYHTILHIDSDGKHRQKMATAGERWGNRRWLGKPMTNGFVRDEPIEDFFMDYLVGIAGWSMQ
jgi:hypothetical protein